MRKNRNPFIKTFLLRQSTNFSSRNILKKHKQFISKPGIHNIYNAVSCNTI